MYLSLPASPSPHSPVSLITISESPATVISPVYTLSSVEVKTPEFSPQPQPQNPPVTKSFVSSAALTSLVGIAVNNPAAIATVANEATIFLKIFFFIFLFPFCPLAINLVCTCHHSGALCHQFTILKYFFNNPITIQNFL